MINLKLQHCHPGLISRSIILTLSLLFLTGCGFHLRAMHPLPHQLSTLYVKTPHKYSYFTKQLKKSLRHVNVNVANTKHAAPYTLEIQRIAFTHNTPTLGTSTQARVYRLHYDMLFQLIKRNGKTVLSPRTISTHSQLTLNRNQLLNTNDELTLIKHEMERRLIDRLFYQLSSNNVKQSLR